MDVLSKIRKELKAGANAEISESNKKFFKEGLKSYGFRSADVQKIIKEALKELKDASKEEVFALCEELWKSGFLEECSTACDLAYSRRKDFSESDLKIFERWIDNYVTNWAACDTFCNHSMGAFIEMFPGNINKLKTWATSKNRWKKRAAAVTLILPAKKGLFLKDVFEIADILLLDSDDLVQKGYGWMLKAATEMHQKEVFDYVMSKKEIMPRTALRYAIEKMPKDLREKAMKKA